jgi:hypothetical protein
LARIEQQLSKLSQPRTLSDGRRTVPKWQLTHRRPG